MNKQFLRKRWLDFRNGHSIYLAFVLTFTNFILITYNFAVAKISFLNDTIGSLPFFVILFIALYVPAAMLIGYWHRRHQYVVENETMLQENWIWAWLARYQIRLIEGKATPEETSEITRYLELIMRRHKRELLLRSGGPPEEIQDARKQQSSANEV